MRRLLAPLLATPLHPQWLVPTRRSVTRTLLSLARGVVVDVGCADRWASGHLPAGCTYYGIDYPATGVARYGARPDCLADAACLPLQDGSADTVLLLDVLEHLRHPQAALAECARVLRPGGRLLLAVPFLYPVHDAPHDFQRLTEFGLVRDAAAAGLQLESVTATPSSMDTLGALASMALAGSAYEAWCRRRPGLLLAPLLVLAVPLVNLLCWVVGRLLPPWRAFALGYELVARKP